MVFTCECCQYTTEIKCNYGKHIKSKKHKLNSIPKPELVKIETYKCKHCEKEYNHRSSLSKHKKSCIKVNEQEKDQRIKDLLAALNETRIQLDLIRKQLEPRQQNRRTRSSLRRERKDAGRMVGIESESSTKREVHEIFEE